MFNDLSLSRKVMVRFINKWMSRFIISEIVEDICANTTTLYGIDDTPNGRVAT